MGIEWFMAENAVGIRGKRERFCNPEHIRAGIGNICDHPWEYVHHSPFTSLIPSIALGLAYLQALDPNGDQNGSGKRERFCTAYLGIR